MPPCILSTTLEIGASGIAAKVVLMPPRIESIRAEASMSTMPLQVEDQVGKIVVGGAQVDGAAQRFVQERGEGSRLAVDRALGAGVSGELGPEAGQLADHAWGKHRGENLVKSWSPSRRVMRMLKWDRYLAVHSSMS